MGGGRGPVLKAFFEFEGEARLSEVRKCLLFGRCYVDDNRTVFEGTKGLANCGELAYYEACLSTELRRASFG